MTVSSSGFEISLLSSTTVLPASSIIVSPGAMKLSAARAMWGASRLDIATLVLKS